MPLLLSDGRRSGGALLPLPAGAGRYEEEVLPPRAELLCQLSRRALSRRGASRSGRPKVLSRAAVLPERPPVNGASRLGRDLPSEYCNNACHAKPNTQKASCNAAAACLTLCSHFGKVTTRSSQLLAYLEKQTVKWNCSCGHLRSQVAHPSGATAELRQAHHCSCPWELHTLLVSKTTVCRQIFYVCTGCDICR